MTAPLAYLIIVALLASSASALAGLLRDLCWK